MVILTAAAGVIGLAFGLLLLALNGYQEDYGSEGFQTLPYAIPVLALSLFALGVSVRLASENRRSKAKIGNTQADTGEGTPGGWSRFVLGIALGLGLLGLWVLDHLRLL
jgi:hypothetical protein